MLVGWVLGHRRTDDLDLFTTDDHPMGEADRLARGIAAEIGATVEPTQTSPDFRRYALRRDLDSIMVDMDPVEEIVANKICALLGRAEVR